MEAERDAVLKAPGDQASGPEGEAPQPAGQANGKSRDLARLKGLGPEIATVRHTEVLYRQVAHRRDIAASVGRTPSLFASGRRRHDPGISKAGHPRARATMVERAWLWLRDQPDRALRRWFRERVGTMKGRIRRLALVALARQLLVALWRDVETGLLPTGAAFKA